MADNRVEYRFVLKGQTPDSISQARLAEYLAELAALYGDESAVHFVRLEESSLAVVSGIEPEAEQDVSDRVRTADTEAAPAETRRAYQSLRRKIAEDGGPATISRGPAVVLQWPVGQADSEPLVYGPFWQPGHLDGLVILVGGKGDPGSIRLQNVQGELHTCKGRRDVIKRLRPHLYEGPIRLIGRGKWLRDGSGQWRLLQFDVEDFEPLSDETLSAAIARLQAIDADWKRKPDLADEIDRIRREH